MSRIYIISDDLAAFPELASGAKAMGADVTAICFGDEAAAQSIATCGADAIVYCPTTDGQQPEAYAKAITAMIKEAPAAVLVSNTIRGRDIAGKVAALLDCAVFTNAADIAYDGEKMTCSRTVYGGTAVRKVASNGAFAVATVNGGAFEITEGSAAAPICAIAGEADGAIRLISKNEKQEVSVNLAVAKRIVDVGRGLAAEEDLEMMRKLAAVIGAEVGCSRPVAENNKWLPKSSYMGITGVQVKPDVIIVCGCSGQVQHIGGINKSKIIVAINKDKNAAIFKNCDFGLAGDMYKIIPSLIEKLS